MSLQCAQNLLNRAYGSPKQSLEMSGNSPSRRIIFDEPKANGHYGAKPS